MSRSLWILVFLVLIYIIVGTMDYASAKVSALILLDPSMQPAYLAECQRAHPTGKPVWSVSRQSRSNEPWHHRFCLYE